MKANKKIAQVAQKGLEKRKTNNEKVPKGENYEEIMDLAKNKKGRKQENSTSGTKMIRKT